MFGQRRRRLPALGRLHSIEDHPEHHHAPGAWAWDPDARRQRDVAATHAARRFLEGGHGADSCWRCEVAVATGALGLCETCLDELRRG